MLETLAGRLTWERTRDGICLEIPAHLSVKGSLYSLSFGLVWLWTIAEDPLRWLAGTLHVGLPHWSYPGTLLLMPLLILCWILWIILTSTRIVLSPEFMAIEYRVFGIRWLSQRCTTRLLHHPRFSLKNTVNPAIWRRWPELQIDQDYRTKVLAIGVDQAEAEAVIAKMIEVYPFPKYLPNESAAGVEAG